MDRATAVSPNATTEAAAAPPITEVVTGLEELRSVLGAPSAGAVQKDIGRLDAHSRAFVARSPFLLVGSADADGRSDVSPRGDGPGFVHVLDDHTLALPERPGNRRGDTLTNVLATGEVGLFFMVPGVDETLRINGRAVIARDRWLLERMQVQGKVPLLALVVTVREAYFHCAKAFRRSHLWDPARFVPRQELPSLGQIMHDQLQVTACTADELDQDLEQAYRKTLY
jgi:PPOX class probable FMN-dependent enzyme